MMIVYALEAEDIGSEHVPWLYTHERFAKIAAGRTQRENVRDMYPDIRDADIHFYWKEEGEARRMYLILEDAFFVRSRAQEIATTFIIYPVEVFEQADE